MGVGGRSRGRRREIGDRRGEMNVGIKDFILRIFETLS